MSEELKQIIPFPLGRYQYYKLGQTTLRQLKKEKIIKKVNRKIEDKKPDGIIVLPGGIVKAVIEYKAPGELSTESKIKEAIEQEIEVARCLCKLLIVSDGTKSYWINALNGERIKRKREIEINGRKEEVEEEISYVFDAQKIIAGTLTQEEIIELENLLDEIDYSITETNNVLKTPSIIDPTPLAKEVWQKIWINTGKEPEKCLYNVVEIFVFKFLSDIGVLTGDNGFDKVYQKKVEESPKEALKYYATVCRKAIKEMFPPGEDGTTIINGTIFVNEEGEANLQQAELFGQVLESFKKFEDEYGSLKYVSKEFKTRLYETFLRQSAGIKSLGQYFTPRNVVRAMVKMSKANMLPPGTSICDPFCGVGGFILETILINENIWREFEPKNGKIDPQITLVGYDKGTDEKEDERTIILAKANMLIYLSDFLAKYHSKTYLEEFAKNAFNKVFKLLRTNLGTFGLREEEKYDLILTNPPYVTSGVSSIKEIIKRENMDDYYTANGRGTEALAIEWIIKSLKKGGQALVIVPDGLLMQKNMLDYIKKKCIVEGIISLPPRTFYATPKKTYILILEKKYDENKIQQKPVFLYLVSEIGETRDSKRFKIDQNDLEEAVKLFNYFKVNLEPPDNLRCKVMNFEEFDKLTHWMVDKFWTEDEKQKLGIIEEKEEISAEDFYNILKNMRDYLDTQLRDDFFFRKDFKEKALNINYAVISLDKLFDFPAIKGVTEKFILNNQVTYQYMEVKKQKLPLVILKIIFQELNILKIV